ncbi:19235_t:CDS:2, partial [Gigaspora rosea]
TQRIVKRRSRAEASATYNSSGDKLNDVENGKISILRPKEADNVITRLIQAVPEITTHRPLVYIRNSKRTKRRWRQMQREATARTPKLELFWLPMVNRNTNMDDDDISDTISLDSNSETFGSDSEVETAKSHNIMSLENLNNTIKQLEKEIKSNKHSEIAFSNLPLEACVVTYPGKDSDRWWNSDDLVDQ